MSQASLLEHSGTVQKLTTSQDASGGTVNIFTTRQAGVPCLIRPASSTEILAFAAQQLQVSHIIVTLYGGTQVGDKFIEDATARQFDIRGIANSQAQGSIAAFTTLQGWELV